MRTFLRNYKLSVPVIAAALFGLAWVAIGYFGVNTLFFDREVSEAAPVFDSPPAAVESAMQTENPDDPIEMADESTDDSGDEMADESTDDSGDEMVDDNAPNADTVAGDTPAPVVAESGIITEFTGTFESGAHSTSGTASVLGNGTGQRFLRFEDFETDNGPDLNVYLVNSSTGDVSDFIDLGDLKGNIGEQNYEIPEDVDLEVYDEVVVWCVRFGVGFGNAQLMAV